MARLFDAVRESDFILALGSSLRVSPASQVALGEPPPAFDLHRTYARPKPPRLVIVSPAGLTSPACEDSCDLRVRCSSDVFMKGLMREILGAAVYEEWKARLPDRLKHYARLRDPTGIPRPRDMMFAWHQSSQPLGKPKPMPKAALIATSKAAKKTVQGERESARRKRGAV